jgi:alcohol dehydrogenase class IV
MASMMGAIAFQKGLGAAHSLAHPLSTEFGLHHGTANAVVLPCVLEFNRRAVGSRMEHLAEAFGGVDPIDVVRELNDIAGIHPRLREYGITEEKLPALADKAVEDQCHTLNPRPCTRETLLEMYRQAF